MNNQTIIGKLSGKMIPIPNVNLLLVPPLAPPGIIHNGEKAKNFDGMDSSWEYPDVRSFKRKFGLLIPVTNTSMEHELWSILLKNKGPNGLEGIGLHTTNVLTSKPQLKTEKDLIEYKK
jgi:maleate isomerase